MNKPIVKQKLAQIDRLVEEIRILLGAEEHVTPLDPVAEWLSANLVNMVEKKRYKAGELYLLFNPSKEILGDIGFSDNDQGQLNIFGKMLRKYVGVNLKGRTLHVGVTDGTSAYRVIGTD